MEPAEQGRLDGWKDIAAYLKRTPRTVQRWEKLEGLPVHRIAHSTAASVFAYPGEIDAWWNDRQARLDPPSPSFDETTQGPVTANRSKVAMSMAALLATAGIFTFVQFPSRSRFTNADVITPVRRGNVELATISPDGKKVVYAWDQNNRHTLTLHDLDTRQERILSEGVYSSYYGFTFSRTGDFLYFVAQRPGQLSALYRIPAVGGAETRVLENIDSPVSFSPSGKKMAFIREGSESQLMIAGADGSDPRPLSARKRPEYLDYPAWSPDGNAILVSFVSPAGARLISVNPDTGKERHVGDQVWDFLRFPVWLDAATLAVSVRSESRSAERVVKISYPAGKVEWVNLRGDRLVTLSASSDGRALSGVAVQGMSSIWTTDGSAPPKEILAPLVGSRGVAWAADGKLLLGGHELSSATADGANLTTVLNNTPVSSLAICGANRLVYSRSDPPNVGLWQTDLRGGASRLVVPAWHEGRPSCSPDGEWILYSDHWGPAYQVPSAGGKEQLLIEDRVLSPVISWDNQWIAAYRHKTSTWGDPQEIAIYPRAGGRAVKTLPIRPGEFEWTPLRWTRDSKSIAYIEKQGGLANVWMRPLDGGPGRQLTNFQGGLVSDFDCSPDGHLALELRTVARDVYVVRD